MVMHFTEFVIVRIYKCKERRKKLSPVNDTAPFPGLGTSPLLETLGYKLHYYLEMKETQKRESSDES